MIDTARERHAGIFTLFGVVTCFLFSGVAALLYQIAWLREFALVFGTSELAVAAVLAAYMGGLGMGAALAARYLSDNTRPVLTYALLEGGIALSALLVPVFVAAASGLYILVLGGQPQPPGSSSFGQPMFYLFVAFNVLALPTGFMGATLPLLTRYAVTNNRNVAPRTGLLYGVNTLGAVGGAVLTGFILLPRFGLRNTIWIGVSINLLVFLVAALLARTSSRARVEADPGLRSGGAGMTSGFLQSCVKPLWTDTGTKRAIHGQAAWILPVIAISGMNAFVYEVLWTRLLSHAIGGSIYAFTTMLAVFLGGIAIGGGLSGYIATSRARAIPMFIICQILIAISSIFMGLRGNVWVDIGISG